MRRTEKCIVRAMCGVQSKDRQRTEDFMLQLGFKDNNTSVDYGKQCVLVWSCFEEMMAMS